MAHYLKRTTPRGFHAARTHEHDRGGRIDVNNNDRKGAKSGGYRKDEEARDQREACNAFPVQIDRSDNHARDVTETNVFTEITKSPSDIPLRWSLEVGVLVFG